MSWAALLAGLISGVLGALGLGGGSVLILYLTLFAGLEQAQAQGINLIFFVPCALLAVLLYARKKMIVWKLWVYAALLGLAGAFLGSWLAGIIGGELLKKIFGGLLLLFGLVEIFHKKKKEKEEGTPDEKKENAPSGESG